MTNIYHGTYVGPREDLKGKRAIVRVETFYVEDMVPSHGEVIARRVTAQFDDMELHEAFNWHEFNRSDFEFDYQYGVAQ